MNNCIIIQCPVLSFNQTINYVEDYAVKRSLITTPETLINTLFSLVNETSCTDIKIKGNKTYVAGFIKQIEEERAKKYGYLKLDITII